MAELEIACFGADLTPFKAEWDPKDLQERTFVIGRYIR